MLDMKMCWCIIFALLLIIVTPQLLTMYPILRILFTDKINYMLIMLIVVFIILIDLHCGILIGLVILYIMIYINNTKDINKISIKVPSNTLPSSIKIMPGMPGSPAMPAIPAMPVFNNNNIINNSNKLRDQFVDNNISVNIPDTNNVNSESEFTYNNTNVPFPNKNINPFQPKDTNTNTLLQNNTNFVQQTINSQNKNDMITQVGEPDRSGFDVSGCRYDMKNSPQNLTKFGPPLSQCSAYDTNKAKICGTVFYPLNA